ncbi:MAG: hypothetical protein H7242_04590 [Microbacteriaceae bacterium]|nr:hypothetical protein [Burkholderiaceae bacterium]
MQPDEKQTPGRRRWQCADVLAACLLGASLAGGAHAAPLADPTRPPSAAGHAVVGAETEPARSRDSRDSRDGRATAPAARPAAPAPAMPVLQSVRVPVSGPALAMIDGQLVKAGDTVGGRLVQAIDQQGITLSSPAGAERVPLLGGNPKQPPGSIATTHATRYEPAAAEASDLPARSDRPGLAMPYPTTPVPLSVAGRTVP